MTCAVGIDQGTSGTTVIVVDSALRTRSKISRPVESSHGPDGTVEQDPWKVLQSIVDATAIALASLPSPTHIATAGFAHQGETVLAWDARTLDPLTPAIVWSDRRADSVIRNLVERGLEDRVTSQSGMRLDSYFCAAKFRWMLDSYAELGVAARRDQLRIGTLETWLLAQLGLEPCTDGGTASRTQLVGLGESTWNSDLLDVFGLDLAWLPRIVPSLGYRGDLSHPGWTFTVPLHCVVVDQPAALVGTGGINRGDMKVTFGTGAFVVVNAGNATPPHQLDVITSVGWTDSDGPTYTLDGGVFSAGSALDWLSRLGIDTSPDAHERVVGRTPSYVRVLPALHGIGAPTWEREADTRIEGLQADTTAEDLLQGFLDSVGFRVREVVHAMVSAGVPPPSALRVDGGLTRSTYLMQSQSNVLGIPIEVGVSEEATALGVAMLAGATAGIWDLNGVSELARRPTKSFMPIDSNSANDAFKRWRESFHR